MFLSYFADKLDSIRASITPDTNCLDVTHPQQESFNQFYPNTLSELLEIIAEMRVSSCPLDIIQSFC